MLRIIIDGDRGEGATTLAIAIAQALRAHHPEFQVEYHGCGKWCTELIREQINGAPIAPGTLETKAVRIIDNGGPVHQSPSPRLLLSMLREFTLKLNAAFKSVVDVMEQQKREHAVKSWEDWTRLMNVRGLSALREFPLPARTVESRRLGEEPTTIVIDEAAALPPEFNQLAELHRIGNAHARALDQQFIAGMTDAEPQPVIVETAAGADPEGEAVPHGRGDAQDATKAEGRPATVQLSAEEFYKLRRDAGHINAEQFAGFKPGELRFMFIAGAPGSEFAEPPAALRIQIYFPDGQPRMYVDAEEHDRIVAAYRDILTRVGIRSPEQSLHAAIEAARGGPAPTPRRGFA